MRSPRISYRPIAHCLIGGLSIALVDGLRWRSVSAQADLVTLAAGFTPNPTVLEGIGGGDHPAAEIVNTQNTPTGPCLGYISASPHEEVTFETQFNSLEMRVESELDTTLVISGPDGVWCNDDNGGPNPAIAGQWVAGDYRIWIGAYRAGEVPEYELFISDNSDNS